MIMPADDGPIKDKIGGRELLDPLIQGLTIDGRELLDVLVQGLSAGMTEAPDFGKDMPECLDGKCLKIYAPACDDSMKKGEKIDYQNLEAEVLDIIKKPNIRIYKVEFHYK